MSLFLSMTPASICPDCTTLILWASSFWRTSSSTFCVTACGLMKTKAEFLTPLAILMAFSRHGFTSRSSSRSKSDCFLPSKSTGGSPAQKLMVSWLMPAPVSLAPKGSSAIFTSSQLAFSTRPSNGLAEACAPLSPVSGSDFRPKLSHCWKMAFRMESPAASIGLVAPMTSARNTSHGSTSGSHSTSKYLMQVPGAVNFARMRV
mmetsp:Transcript_44747/g.124428  ORF Transcript_44747/g.124428 Transcript_44747/m.124428 type:complete len:204 (-) Transcript_44747:215-826(-)